MVSFGHHWCGLMRLTPVLQWEVHHAWREVWRSERPDERSMSKADPKGTATAFTSCTLHRKSQEAEGPCRWEGKGKDIERHRKQESCSQRVFQHGSTCFNHVQQMSWVWFQLAQFMSCQSETVSPKLSFRCNVRCIQRHVTAKLLRHTDTWLQQLSIVRIYMVARTSRHAVRHSSSGQKLPVSSITIIHIFYKWSKTGLTSDLYSMPSSHHWTQYIMWPMIDSWSNSRASWTTNKPQQCV